MWAFLLTPDLAETILGPLLGMAFGQAQDRFLPISDLDGCRGKPSGSHNGVDQWAQSGAHPATMVGSCGWLWPKLA